MAHIYSFRKGWQSEHLAKFILSKFSFVAEPSTVSDDVGSDFFCTLFKIEDKKYLLPQNSFAIQIKSKKDMQRNKNKIVITKKTNYLNNLEIPFFVGVVDRDNLKMEIFSGESIDHFFTLYGDPTGKGASRVFIELLDNRDGEKLYYDTGNDYFLKFPKIVEIDSNFDYEKNSNHVDELFKICRLIQKNLSAKKSCEYIYDNYGGEKISIYAGPGSNKTFRNNFFKRLAEVFYNLKWIDNNPHLKMDLKEFELYKNIYLKLLEQYEKLPEYLTSVFSDLNKSIEEKIAAGATQKETKS